MTGFLQLATGDARIDTETGLVTVRGTAHCLDGPECPDHGTVIRFKILEIEAGALDIVPEAILGTLAITFNEGSSRPLMVKGRRRTVVLQVYRGEFERAKHWYGRLLDAMSRAGVLMTPWQS